MSKKLNEQIRRYVERCSDDIVPRVVHAPLDWVGSRVSDAHAALTVNPP